MILWHAVWGVGCFSFEMFSVGVGCVSWRFLSAGCFSFEMLSVGVSCLF